MMSFNMEWLRLCRDKLKDNGTIWISGTYHNIFSVANCLTELGYKILNVIIWEKTNPPVNISCRYLQIFYRIRHLGKEDAESTSQVQLRVNERTE